MRCHKVYIGSDHGGFLLKQELSCFLLSHGFQVEDAGIYSADAADYPDIAIKVSEKVRQNPENKGILICGSGIGMSVAANKVKGIRAALCSEPLSAKLSREHNDANILCLGERLIGLLMATEIVSVFLSTDFCGDRHTKRIQKITDIEERNDV